jgi:hypothetical protein
VPRSPRLRALLYYGACAALTSLVLAAIPALRGHPLRVPVTYDGDGMIFTVLAKAVRDDGLLHATRIGAPFGSDIVDWPIGMWLPFGIIAGLLAVSGEPGTAVNLYWLSTVVFSAAAAAWALRRLRQPPALAFVLGILYACQPYAFYRNVGHINLAFPLVPLLALVCLRVAGARPEDETGPERAITFAACVAQGFCYVYYTFFTCMLLAIAAPIGWLRRRDRRLLRRAGMIVLVLCVATGLTILPSAIYWQRHGTNPDLDYKAAAQTDQFGLKLRHLLVPIVDHPLPLLRAIASRVEGSGFPDENENTFGKLGAVGALGFLALLVMLVGRAAGLLPGRDEELDAAAALTLATLLVSQVGGFASLFSVFVAPDIRAYNRIVVFISFFSLLAFGTLLSRVGTRPLPFASLGSRLRVALAAVLLVAGLLDEVPAPYLARLRGGSAATFVEDRAFTRAIEARLPAGAMVFQLPHLTIPVDRNTWPPMIAFDPGRAYLHSRSLRWSWGSVIGRTHEWQSGVAAMPPAEMLPTLALAGFSGLWLDRWGYTGERGLRHDELEKQIAAASGQPALASSRGRYSFFDLTRLRLDIESRLGPERLARRRSELLADLPVLRWREGCSDEAPATRGWARSCGRSASVLVRNLQEDPLEVTLAGTVRARAGGGLVRLRSAAFEDALDLSRGEGTFHRVTILESRTHLRIALDFEGTARCGAGTESPTCFEVASLRATTRRLRQGVPSGVDQAMPAP